MSSYLADCCLYLSQATTAKGIYTSGIGAIYGGSCFDCQFSGYLVRPPVLDSDTCTPTEIGCRQYNLDYADGTNPQGEPVGVRWDRHPGDGASPVISRFGYSCIRPIGGTGGMIKVSWG